MSKIITTTPDGLDCGFGWSREDGWFFGEVQPEVGLVMVVGLSPEEVTAVVWNRVERRHAAEYLTLLMVVPKLEAFAYN